MKKKIQLPRRRRKKGGGLTVRVDRTRGGGECEGLFKYVEFFFKNAIEVARKLREPTGPLPPPPHPRSLHLQSSVAALLCCFLFATIHIRKYFKKTRSLCEVTNTKEQKFFFFELRWSKKKSPTKRKRRNGKPPHPTPLQSKYPDGQNKKRIYLVAPPPPVSPTTPLPALLPNSHSQLQSLSSNALFPTTPTPPPPSTPEEHIDTVSLHSPPPLPHHTRFLPPLAFCRVVCCRQS